MPIYEYSCNSCNLRFEVKRRAGLASEERCPDCNSEAKRVFTPVGVLFKGTGFHATDYRTQTAGQTEKNTSEVPAEPACGAECSKCPAAE